VEAITAGTTRDGIGTEVYQERSYQQFDCIGGYLWIWERLIRAEGRTDVVARQVHRAPSSEQVRKVR
jgi:hypothetical protein